MFWPHTHLAGSRFVFSPTQTPVSELSDVDVVVVQRQCTVGNIMALKQMKDLGLKIVYDLDDDLWGIPGTSPAKKLFEPVKDGFGKCMELCDAITVSTGPLKTAVQTAVPSTKSKKIFVIPNGVDFDYLRPPLLPKPEGHVTVGWGGSNTHQGDIGSAWSVLPDLLEELPEMYLEFVGMAPPPRIVNHPRVKIREFCPVGEYVSRYSTWGWDIVLAPLADIRFNRSKSGIKVTETAAIGGVCLMSNVGSYARFCEHDSGLRWLLCNTPQEWKSKLTKLVKDPLLRVSMAAKIRETATRHYEQTSLMPLWKEAFESVMV